MGFLTRCKRLFSFAFLLQNRNTFFSFFLKSFLILSEKQQSVATPPGNGYNEGRAPPHGRAIVRAARASGLRPGGDRRRQAMNILIVGCGRVGRRLVHVLERLGHDVSVLDEDAANLALLNELEPPFSGMAVAGVPIDGDVLRSAGIEACDAVAAVTKDDNINLMVAQIARELFGVKHVIARVAEPSRKEVYTERFGLRIVCGTNLTAQGLLAGILQEEDDEDQCVMFGSSTANFSAVPAAKHQWNRPLSSVQPPRAGMMVFGVLRANGTMELANTQPTLHVDDKILFAELAD